MQNRFNQQNKELEEFNLGGGLMGCWFCNPLCGKCKPPMVKIICPYCGRAIIVSKPKYLRQEDKYCPFCQKIVSWELYIPPAKCSYSAKICAYPCGKKSKSNLGMPQKCPNNTPPENSPYYGKREPESLASASSPENPLALTASQMPRVPTQRH